MSKRKILLVDDSKSARYALRLLLQKHNFDVDTAESAESALEKVKGDLPDAIFMDHLMPGMNGFEALDVLKSEDRTSHIPVVMCTSNDDEPYQIQARERGALGILPKPATPDKLGAILRAIDKAVEESRASGAAPAAAATTAPALEPGELTAQVQAEFKSLVDKEIKPLLQQTLDQRLESLQADISETLLARSAEQLGQWVEAEMSRVREELSASPGNPESITAIESEIKQLRDALTTAETHIAGLGESPASSGVEPDVVAQIDSEIGKLKSSLVKMETDHAQAVVKKISTRVLPELLQKQIDELEQQVYDRLDLRLQELSDRLMEEVTDNPQLIRRISERAETAAEQRASEVAVAQAQAIAETSAAATAGEVTDSLIHSAQSAVQRMYWMAGLAAGAGILSSLIVFLLLS
jgi:DNA-binding response OmpR family regulator